MKNRILTSLVAGAALATALPVGAETADAEAIRNLLSTYETALNARDTETIVSLYADDGVFMPQHSLPQVGREKILAAYRGVFAAITLNISFEIDEISVLSENWAFARTRSNGSVKINATGDSGPEANQELFLLQRSVGNSWKIARYIFSTTNPPRS